MHGKPISFAAAAAASRLVARALGGGEAISVRCVPGKGHRPAIPCHITRSHLPPNVIGENNIWKK